MITVYRWSVVDLTDIRELTADLPRSYEVLVRDRIKFRVGRIVYLTVAPDEQTIGIGFPRPDPSPRAPSAGSGPELEHQQGRDAGEGDQVVAQDRPSQPALLGGLVPPGAQTDRVGDGSPRRQADRNRGHEERTHPSHLGSTPVAMETTPVAARNTASATGAAIPTMMPLRSVSAPPSVITPMAITAPGTT